MERKAILLCCVVGFLGLLSAATGFAAEAKRIKYDQIIFPSPSECIYPRSPAVSLALTAAVSLMMAQIIINVATGCICCRKGPHLSQSNWTLALTCFIVSWFTFVIAFLILLTGAALNDQHGEEDSYFGNYYCSVIRPGIFAGAAILSLASVVFGIEFYLALMSSTKNNRSNTFGSPVVAPNQGSSSISMGQPQFSPQDPVFVHEDTYIRRQFT